jgi:hypothetical protein
MGVVGDEPFTCCVGLDGLITSAVTLRRQMEAPRRYVTNACDIGMALIVTTRFGRPVSVIPPYPQAHLFPETKIQSSFWLRFRSISALSVFWRTSSKTSSELLTIVGSS